MVDDGFYPKLPPGLPQEALDRQKTAEARWLEVLGDAQPEPLGGWIYRASHEFGPEWESPASFAARSEENLAKVLAKLEALSKLVQPVNHPNVWGGKKKTSKRRR